VRPGVGGRLGGGDEVGEVGEGLGCLGWEGEGVVGEGSAGEMRA
jgi:hypothetical protein